MWEDWINIDSEETTKMFHNLNENDLVTGIQEVVKQDTTNTSDPEEMIPVHVFHYEGESASTNESIK